MKKLKLKVAELIKKLRTKALEMYAFSIMFMTGFFIDFLEIYIDIIALVAVGISFKMAVTMILSKKLGKKENLEKLLSKKETLFSLIPIIAMGIFAVLLILVHHPIYSIYFVWMSLLMFYLVKQYNEKNQLLCI